MYAIRSYYGIVIAIGIEDGIFIAGVQVVKCYIAGNVAPRTIVVVPVLYGHEYRYRQTHGQQQGCQHPVAGHHFTQGFGQGQDQQHQEQCV